MDEGEHRQRLDIWSAAWSAAAVLALLGLVVPGYVLDRLWLTDTRWLAPVVPFVALPLLVIVLTGNRRPARATAAAALALSAGSLALGVAMQRLLVWAATLDGSWYTGPGSLYYLRPPWHAYEALALTYAGLAALVIVLLLTAMTLTRRRAAQRGGGSEPQSTNDRVASVGLEPASGPGRLQGGDVGRIASAAKTAETSDLSATWGSQESGGGATEAPVTHE